MQVYSSNLRSTINFSFRCPLEVLNNNQLTMYFLNNKIGFFPTLPIHKHRLSLYVLNTIARFILEYSTGAGTFHALHLNAECVTLLNRVGFISQLSKFYALLKSRQKIAVTQEFPLNFMRFCYMRLPNPIIFSGRKHLS